MNWAFKYHLGSLAFGSFLLAVVWMLIAVFEYLNKKIEATSNRVTEGFTRVITGCVRCCLQCCHRFIKFINKNAYA